MSRQRICAMYKESNSVLEMGHKAMSGCLLPKMHRRRHFEGVRMSL